MEFTEEELGIQEKKFRIILCGANAYDQKYYFNKKFDALPDHVKEDLHIISVLFTEEIGGIFTIGFTPAGEVMLDSTSEGSDYLYDEIGAGLMIKKIYSTRQELIEALSIYYRVTFLHEDASALLGETE